MKLDLGFIKQILSVIEKHRNDEISLLELIERLKLKRDDIDVNKLRAHIRILKDRSCIDCEYKSLGFREQTYGGNNYEIVLSTSVLYRLTDNGHQMLKEMKIWNKCWNKFKTSIVIVIKSVLYLLRLLKIFIIFIF